MTRLVNGSSPSDSREDCGTLAGVKRTAFLMITLLAAACGGGGAANKNDSKTASDANEKKADDVGSIGDLASAQGGIGALGGAGNREEGSTGAEVSFSGAFAAHEAEKKSPVKIDGVLKEWPARTPAKETLSGKTDGLSLDVGVMYDDNKLYVAAEVVDPKGSRSGKHAESEDHVAMTIAFPGLGRGQLKAYDVGFWAGKPGSSVGAVKWLWSTLSRLRTSTAMFTMVKTPSSSSAVVPPSAGTAPTNVIRPKASSVVKMIAT